MSGGLLFSVESVMMFIEAKFHTALPFDGFAADSAEILVRVVTALKADADGYTYARGLDAVLGRQFEDGEQFNDVSFMQHAIALTFDSKTFHARMELAKGLTGLQQLAKTTVLQRFHEVFPLSKDRCGTNVEYLEELGYDPAHVGEMTALPEFRDLFIELYLTAILLALVHHQDSLGHSVEPNRKEAPMHGAVKPNRSRTKAAAPQTEAAQFVTKVAFAEAVDELKALILQLAGGGAPPKPAVPAPARARPRTVLEIDSSVESIDSDSEDYSDNDLEGLAQAAKQRGALVKGIAAMRGTQHSTKGESLHFVKPATNSAAAPPVVDPSTSFFGGPLLQNAMVRAEANHAMQSELTMDELISMIYSPEGLFLLSVCGTPFVFQISASAKAVAFAGKVATTLFNPDAHPSLARLGASQKAPHLFCVTIDQFEANINDQMVKSLRRSELFGEATDHVMKVLLEYKKKCMRLFDSHFGGHSATRIQAQQHHVTAWSQFLLFHLNRWMRAMVHRDIGLLLLGFDNTWHAIYHPLLGSDESGFPRVQLLEALQFLAYRCPQCNRTGACALYCPNDACRASVKAVVESEPSDQPGYMAKFKKFLAALPASATKGDKSHEAFAKTEAFKQAGFVLQGKVPKKAKATSHVGCQARSNEQQNITLHVCPNFQLA